MPGSPQQGFSEVSCSLNSKCGGRADLAFGACRYLSLSKCKCRMTSRKMHSCTIKSQIPLSPALSRSCPGPLHFGSRLPCVLPCCVFHVCHVTCASIPCFILTLHFLVHCQVSKTISAPGCTPVLTHLVSPCIPTLPRDSAIALRVS